MSCRPGSFGTDNRSSSSASQTPRRSETFGPTLESWSRLATQTWISTSSSSRRSPRSGRCQRIQRSQTPSRRSTRGLLPEPVSLWNGSQASTHSRSGSGQPAGWGGEAPAGRRTAKERLAHHESSEIAAWVRRRNSHGGRRIARPASKRIGDRWGRQALTSASDGSSAAIIPPATNRP
jgi:hypothetical protein